MPPPEQAPSKEATHQAGSFELTPKTGLELSQAVAQFGFGLWAHGTPIDDKGSFFEKGVLAGTRRNLEEIANPIDANAEGEPETISDLEFMNNWGHRGQNDSPPKVVLLAIPRPSPEEGLYSGDIKHHVIDPENAVVPPELVLGIYTPQSQTVTLNPKFDLDTQFRTDVTGSIMARASAYREQDPMEAHHPAVSVQHRTVRPAHSDDPDVW
jgi:hypothetical protein